MNEKIKSTVLPLAIIVIGLLLGGFVLLNQKLDRLDSNAAALNNSQSFRFLSFKAPGIFCAGCTANIEGYLGAVDGVQSVSASLRTKRVDVIYDPSIVDKNTILSNQILDIYGREYLGDEPFTGSSQVQAPSTVNLPQGLAFKLQDAAGIVSQLDNPEDYNSEFDRINQAILNKDYQQAEDLLDELIGEL